VVVDAFTAAALGFAVAFRRGKGLGVHDFLGGHLVQFGVEAKGGVREEAEMVMMLVVRDVVCELEGVVGGPSCK